MNLPKDFKEIARQRTGTSFLDSGSAYGYQWQHPPIPDDMPLYYARPYSGSFGVDAGLMISTATLLDEHFTIDEKATRAFRLWASMGANKDESWFTLARDYIERLREKGKIDLDADLFDWNSYNSDNDFDQVVEIIAPGLYAEWAIIFVHTGCDVRSGYTTPVIARGYDAVEELLCSDRISLYCYRCGDGPSDLYEAERQGWKPRLNKLSVAMICPKCHKVAMTFPIDSEQLARDKAKVDAAKVAS